jgi:hypothetical protein
MESPMIRCLPLLVPSFLLLLASPAPAAPSTASGRISITQVRQMLDKAPTDRTARQVLTAYLAGVGEGASAIADMGDLPCRSPLSLDAASVRRAIGGRKDGSDVAATPLIVRDMLVRAGCRR